MTHEGDDFWQASSIKPFDFDDEEKQTLPVKTPESVLSVKPTNEPFLKPSIITCQRRPDLIELLARDVPEVKSHPARQEPKSYILDIVHKQKAIDFSPYKSKSDKLSLLDAAICCYDGNVITAVTIFLSKTLKQSIFDEIIQKRPIALDHYRSYRELASPSQPYH